MAQVQFPDGISVTLIWGFPVGFRITFLRTNLQYKPSMQHFLTCCLLKPMRANAPCWSHALHNIDKRTMTYVQFSDDHYKSTSLFCTGEHICWDTVSQCHFIVGVAQRQLRYTKGTSTANCSVRCTSLLSPAHLRLVIHFRNIPLKLI